MRNKILTIFTCVLVTLSLHGQTCQDAGIGTNTPMSKLEIRGCTNLSNASALNVTDSNASSIFYIRNDHNIGINTTSPTSLFSIGSSNQFQVNTTGNLVMVNNVAYSWPSSQGSANYILSDNGSGNLTWTNGNLTAWILTGNSGTTAGTNFIGTTDAKDFVFKTNSAEFMRITSGGSLGIGTTTPTSKFSIGLSSQFQVNSTGNVVKINNVTYSWPSTQGSANYILSDDGSGNLTWTNGNLTAWILTGNSGTTAGTNFIGTTDAKDFVFKTNSAEFMRITSGGSLGIGTTTPTSKFSIGSSSQFQVNSTGNVVKINNVTYSWPSTQGAANTMLQDDGSGNLTWTVSAVSAWLLTGNTGTNPSSNFIGTTDAEDFAFKTNSAEFMRITSGGSLGIGTTTPTSKFSIGSSSQFQVNSTGNVVKINNVTYSWPSTQGAANAMLQDDGSGNLTWTVSAASAWLLTGNAGTSPGTNFIGTTDAQDFVFKADNSERMRIVSGGSVGIGTSTPSGQLDVTGVAGDGGLVIPATNLDPGMGYSLTPLENSGKLLEGWNRQAGNGEIDFISNRGAGSVGGFSFYDYTNSGTLSSPLMTIQGAGNVGIGTITPQVPLSVAGNAEFGSGDNSGTTSAATIRGANGSGTNIAGASLTVQSGLATGNAASGDIIFRGAPVGSTGSTLQTATTYVTIKGGGTTVGNVGIGNSSPASTLSIGGAGNSLYKTYVTQSSNVDGASAIYAIGTMPGSLSHCYGLIGVVPSGNGYPYGVKGTSDGGSNAGRAYGVYGQVGGATSGYNYGVYGYLESGNNGAGVYGVEGALAGDVNVGGQWAGYFHYRLYADTISIGSTTQPVKYPLYVNGTIYCNSGTAYKLTSNTWTIPSDQRLKNVVSNFSDGLSVIKQIIPVRYRYNGIGGLPTDSTHIGIIAQQVQSVAPYCISSMDIPLTESDAHKFNGPTTQVGNEVISIPMDTANNIPASKVTKAKYKATVLTYNSDGLFYCMINAIKELSAKNDTLELEITELKAQVDALKNK